MGESDKSIRLVTALVECRPDGEYAPWGIKWYDGTVYPFDRIESYSSRSWALGRNKRSESWRVIVGGRYVPRHLPLPKQLVCRSRPRR